MGAHDKIEQYNQLVDMYNLQSENVLYMGDDIPDYPVMKLVGLTGTIKITSFYHFAAKSLRFAVPTQFLDKRASYIPRHVWLMESLIYFGGARMVNQWPMKIGPHLTETILQ